MTALYNEHDPYAAEWLRNLISAGELPAGRVDERSIAELTGADLEGIDELHLFAGIGGWPLALRIAGWTGSVWTGSCPCQPFSSAGKRKGTADERHLWPEMFRLIRECRPVTVFGEQVAGKAALEWLDGVSADLEGEGYAVGSVVLGAHSVGAPHIRQRLFWVADARGEQLRCARPGAVGAAASGVQSEAREQWIRSDVGAGCSAESGGLADAGSPQRDSRCPQRGECDETLKPLPATRSETRRLADASTVLGLGGIDEPERRPEGRTADRGAGPWSDRLGGADEPGPQGRRTRERSDELSPWSASVVIPCRDGKHRRISAQSGDEPLAHGLPRKLGPAFAGLGAVGVRAARRNRVGRLKGYGNAIVPQLAAEFIRDYMESLL